MTRQCPKANARRRKGAAATVVAALLTAELVSRQASAQALVPVTPEIIEIDSAKPSNWWLAAGTGTLMPEKPPAGLTDLPKWQVGWFEFPFRVATAGWRRIALDTDGSTAHVEIAIDGAPPQTDIKAISDPLRADDWVWLEPGAHTLRVSQTFWQGLPSISRIHLEPPAAGQPGAFQLVRFGEKPAARIGECAPLTVEGGGGGKAMKVTVLFRVGTSSDSRRDIAFTPSDRPTRQSIEVPCAAAGDVVATLTMIGARSNAKLQTLYRYSVFDPQPVASELRRGELVADIDTTTKEPDFASGATTVATTSAGSYRETDDRGSTPYVRSRLKLTSASWFAYRMPGLQSNRPYLIEITYPDDIPRVFVTGYRHAGPINYASAIGAETGILWPLSHQMQQMEFVVWPARSDARLIVHNVHDGMKAAISRIRIYAMDSVEQPLNPHPSGHREVMNWFEEGDNLRNFVGLGNELDSVQPAIDRYYRLAHMAGATVVAPTVLVYGFQLFPSSRNLDFNDQRADPTAALLLGAERYSMKVRPEMHARADEVVWTASDLEELGRRLLVSGTMQPSFQLPNGQFRRPPYFNPLNPYVRNWYRTMIREFVERYRDYPAFAGVQLRVSQWVNSSFNNFVSLDWGYDAATVRRFLSDTGTMPPTGLDTTSDAPIAAAARRSFILKNAREGWITWRCEEVRDILSDIAADARAIRPDLTLSLHLSAMSYDRQPGLHGLREMGLDPKLLARIPGLELIDGRFGYGAREGDVKWRMENRMQSLETGIINELALPGQRPSVLMGMQYIEIPNIVARDDQLGWLGHKGSMTSSAVEPPGRLALARRAEMVGLFDVYMLGDGGNGYTFGGSGLKEFMSEFTVLPKVPFERVAGVPEPLILRQFGDEFYAVNLSPHAILADVRFNATGRAIRLTSGEPTELDKSTFRLGLQSYELKAFKCEGCGAIAGATTFEREDFDSR